MLRKIHAPEDVVFLGEQFFPTRIPDDALVVVRPNYPKTFEDDDPHTPAERYDINHRGLMRELVEATYEAELPFDDTELSAVQRTNPEHWARCERATTVVLGSNGYFPPVYEPFAEETAASITEMVPHQRSEEAEIGRAAVLQQVA